MKRVLLFLTVMLCQIALIAEIQAEDKQAKDTTAARLSIEFRRLYIDGDEKKLKATAQELLNDITIQQECDPP